MKTNYNINFALLSVNNLWTRYKIFYILVQLSSDFQIIILISRLKVQQTTIRIPFFFHSFHWKLPVNFEFSYFHLNARRPFSIWSQILQRMKTLKWSTVWIVLDWLRGWNLWFDERSCHFNDFWHYQRAAFLPLTLFICWSSRAVHAEMSSLSITFLKRRVLCIQLKSLWDIILGNKWD